MRLIVIIIVLVISTTHKSLSQNLQKIDTIEIDTISNLKRFSFGIKMGLPNILGLTTEAILPIFKNRVSPYFDYSSFRLNPDNTSIDLNYTNKYNSRYDGVTIINDETGIPYKKIDENISLGFSLSL